MTFSMTLLLIVVSIILCFGVATAPGQATTQPAAAPYPQPVEGDFVIRDFRFRSGQSLPELRLHYRTIGTPRKDAAGVVRNAVLIMHGTTGSSKQFLRDEFDNELFCPGQPLDAERFYIILPDAIGHGESSKPSDGLRARFPNYGYLDMIEGQRRLVTEGLNVTRLRLVMGTSMGGMHTWLWGQAYPDMMDALMPLASVPGQISGRNRMWRRIIIDSVRSDPNWNDGNYTTQPPSARLIAQMSTLMGSNALLRYEAAPTLAEADKVFDNEVAERLKTVDVNDVIYAFDASRDYDPAPGLEKIKAPLLAINSADDLINPPEIGVLEREIKRVTNGRAIMIPLGPETRGHGTHTRAIVWKQQLIEFLRATEPRQ
jgi:homoserine O-acetyltransferase